MTREWEYGSSSSTRLDDTGSNETNSLREQDARKKKRKKTIKEFKKADFQYFFDQYHFLSYV